MCIIGLRLGWGFAQYTMHNIIIYDALISKCPHNVIENYRSCYLQSSPLLIFNLILTLLGNNIFDVLIMTSHTLTLMSQTHYQLLEFFMNP